MNVKRIHARRGLAIALPLGLVALVTQGCPGVGNTGQNASPNPTTAAATAKPAVAAATMAVDAASLKGIQTSLGVTVTDAGAVVNAGAIETLTVRVTSEAEPTGETITLTETAAGSGVFGGNVSLERLFAESGSLNTTAKNGKIAVYAEGGVAADSIAVAYGTLNKVVSYEEPASTVTGLVKVGATPTAGAAVQLSGPTGFTARSTVSRSDGSYAFHDVPTGNYTLVAEANGAQQLTSTIVVP